MSHQNGGRMARACWCNSQSSTRHKRLNIKRGLRRWVSTPALFGILIWCAGADAVTVLFTAPNTIVTLGVPGLEFEKPLNGTEMVQGYRVIEWRDADYSAGPPRWYDDWTGSSTLIDGNANGIWMRGAPQWIQTVTTVPSSLISIHLVGDSNDGLAEVFVDGSLVARLDMFTSAGATTAFILVQALADTPPTIKVSDVGQGQGGRDVATKGAAVLGQGLEFGDAPEGAIAYPTLGVSGGFPTCITVGPASWIQHNNFGALFGPTVDFEGDGNASVCPIFTPNLYDMDECFIDGDAGLMFPDPFTIQGPAGAEVVVPCPNSGGMPLGNTCQTALWGANLDIDVHNHMPNATVGYVNVLIDWDQNGLWAGASQCPLAPAPEHVLVNFPIPNPFDGPLSALLPPGFLIGPNSGYVWARFTITEMPALPPWEGDGAFEDGETEDYLLLVDADQTVDLEFGDAPEGAIAYPTLGINGGFPTCITVGPSSWIQHNNFGALFGPTVDFETDGNAGLCPLFTPNLYDMDECFWDGDAGLIFPDPFTIQGVAGAEVVVPCPNSAGMPLGNTCQTALWGANLDIDVHNHMPNATVGFVNVLIDWDQNGLWAGASQCPVAAAPEHVLVNFPIPNPFDGPLSALNPPGFLIGPNWGYVWARFTITETPVPISWEGDGAFEDGETEDYLLLIGSAAANMDYGDAPDPAYPTLLASNGARHTIVPGYALGPGALALIDGEPNGQPSLLADGDDLNNLADEDGITFITLPLIPGQQAIIDVRNSMGVGGVGFLEGWVDFNGDGSWAEPGDQIFFGQPLSPWPLNFNTYFINVPASATPNIDTYARFRFSSNPFGYGFAGPATDGEVEDYLVRIGSSDVEFDLGDAPDSTNNHGALMTAYPAGGPPGVQANYPTVFQSPAPGPPGPIHFQPLAIAFLGNNVSLETEADIGPDQDPTNNIIPPGDAPDLDMFDDGVIFPVAMAHCASSSFDYLVNIVNPPVTALVLNVWCDWNRDGDWDDVITCPDGTVVPEWAVQNAALPLLPVGLYQRTTPTFNAYHPTDPPTEMWMRITLSDQPAPAPAGVPGEGGSGPAQGYLYGETEDYYFVPRVPEAKWSQLPHGPDEGFDAASDLWWTVGWPPNAKWQQNYDSNLAALHAHDGPALGDRLVLANDWLCMGGLVTDFHWWGGIEQPGSGLWGFHLSIHADDPQTCLPLEPPLWTGTVPIAQITVTNTGNTDPVGTPLMLYDYVLPIPFNQTAGQRYWLDISAVSNDPNFNVIWKWAQSSPAPILCPAAQRQDTGGGIGPWRTISPGNIELAFRVTSDGPAEPQNKVVADDFISDGRSIETVRWWGSYLDDRYDPFSPDAIEPFVQDGWIISFHHGDPAIANPGCPPDVLAGDDPTALGLYFAPVGAVTIVPMGYQDCNGHEVYQYEIDLSKCCYLCSEIDPRDGSVPAEDGVFREVAGFTYWLDIQAIVGITWQFDAAAPCAPMLTGHLPPENGMHFWGWHTSPGPLPPCSPMNQACTGRIVNFPPLSPTNCWDYGGWASENWLCPAPVQPVHMAFELITTEPEPCPCPGDVNGDGVVNGLDIQAFCDCILGNPPAAGVNCACCDYNCTKTPDVGDVSGFVAELLNTTVCP